MYFVMTPFVRCSGIGCAKQTTQKYFIHHDPAAQLDFSKMYTRVFNKTTVAYRVPRKMFQRSKRGRFGKEKDTSDQHHSE